MASSCLPTARDKSRATATRERDSQCSKCNKRKTKTKTTVIVGAGVIGLSIAYWHVQMKKNHKRNVIVLETRNQCFQGASGYNSGLLSWRWFADDLRRLAHHSFNVYQNLAREVADFKERCDYHEDSLFQAHCGKGDTHHCAPAWMKVKEGWHLALEPPFYPAASTATVYVLRLFIPDPTDSELLSNPRGLGNWLSERCREDGVRIETDSSLYRVELCECGRVRSVLVKSARGNDEYKCDDLIFATGTRTPQLVRELFPGFGRDFRETTNSGNWIVVKSACAPEEQMRAEVILDDVVNHQLEFVGRQDQTTNHFVIWVCGLNNEETKLSSVDDQAEPDEDAINRLQEYARQFLRNGVSVQQDGPEVLEKGRTYRPTIDRDLPILTAVSCADLCESQVPKERPYDGQGQCAKSGVWICTGHGKYGITLGLGSGKLMSQMIFGEKPDLDVSALGFPL